MTTPNRQIALEAPWWFAWLVRTLTPQHGGAGSPDYVLQNLWSEYSWRALLHLPGQLARRICLQALKSFSYRMASAELCVLIWFAFDMLTPQMILLLLLTFAGLLVWEAYVPPSERLWAEFVTAIIIPPLMLFLAAALGGISPALKIPGEILSPRLGMAAAVIALFRYNTAREPRPEHRYKDLLLHHHYTWYLNDLWIAGGFAYLMTLHLAAPGIWFLPILTNTSIMLFSTGIRCQLNPISGTTRHCRIDCTLFTDPDEADVRMKTDYLLTGADWFRNFSMQALLEILAFVFAVIPLLTAAGEWYTGDPDAASLNWFRMGMSAGGWLALVVTWPLVKKFNRRTRRVFDQVIQTFSGGTKNNCKYFGTSSDMSSERTQI